MKTKNRSTVLCLEVNFKIDFSHTPGSPAVMYLSNGDPGYPEEPEELDVTEIWVCDDMEKPLFKLTRKQCALFPFNIEEKLLENLE